jgi:pilus assembly protein CpaE
MKIYIACDTPTLTKSIEAAIARLGIECPPSCILSTEYAANAFVANASCEPTIVFFVCSDYTGDELRVLQELCARKHQEVKVVAVGKGLTPATILQAVRAGAIDCLDISSNFDNELAQAVSRVKAISKSSTRSGRLITVIGATGGSGASVLAVNLAVALAQRQERCALLDLHVRGGDLAALLKCNPLYTILSLAAKSEQLDRDMFAQSLTEHDSGVSLLASPEPLCDYKSIRPELIQRCVEMARGMFETVVVDLEDCEHPGQIQTVAASDAIILVLRPDIVSLHRAKLCLQFLLQSGVSADHVFVVLSRVGAPKELDIAQIESVLGRPIVHRLREDPAAVISSVNLGIPLMLNSPQSPLSKSITALADALLETEPAEASTNWGRRQMCRLKSMAALLGAMVLWCGYDYRSTS